MVDWQPEQAAALPGLAAFAPLLVRLPTQRFPSIADLNALAGERQHSQASAALRFIEPDSSGAVGFEAHTYRSGEVAVRPHNWHDLINALAWLAYPLTKREINRLHCESPSRLDATGSRGVARDVLTLLDEEGVLVACADDELAALLQDFRWKSLFWERRADVASKMRFFAFGHALADKMRAPFRGLTAKALLLSVEPSLFDQPIDEQVARMDVRASEWLRNPASLESTRRLSPLPVLGIPGWHAANESADYYDDTGYFRPGRGMRA